MSEEQKAVFKDLLDTLKAKDVITTEDQIRLMSYLY